MTSKLLPVFSWTVDLLRYLWLSISSIKFYQDVYKFYQGYGVRYLFTITFLSTLMYCFLFLNYLLALKEYFVENRLSKSTTTIDYILKQLPEIHYDGDKIAVDQEEPIYLLDKNDQKIAVIDSKNQLSYNEKMKIPIIFSSSTITIAAMEIIDKKKSNFSVGYSNLFSAERQMINEEVIKNRFSTILLHALPIFIYISVPVIIIVMFCSILFEKSFTILLVYVLTNFFGLKSTMQVCSRLVLFSSGIALLLQPIISIFLPELTFLIFIIQMFANLLLFLSIVQIRNNELNQS